MIWAFKMFFKIIGKVLLYSFCIPFAIVCLPFYLPYYLIKERKDKKNGLMAIRRGRIPKYSPSMSGQDYEVYCAKRLAHEGYHNLSVTPGSGDFGADVIGYDRKGRKVCFQCKLYQSSVGVSAVQEVLAAKQYYSGDRAVVITNSTFTSAARKLAKSGNVQLIERYYEKGVDDLRWIDTIEEYHAAID